MVKEITDSSEFWQLARGQTLTVVDFFATWCGPCKEMEPILEEFERQYPMFHFVKINVDNPDLQNVADQCQVKSLPTFHFIFNSKSHNKVVGANSQAIKMVLDSYLKM